MPLKRFARREAARQVQARLFSFHPLENNASRQPTLCLRLKTGPEAMRSRSVAEQGSLEQAEHSALMSIFLRYTTLSHTKAYTQTHTCMPAGVWGPVHGSKPCCVGALDDRSENWFVVVIAGKEGEGRHWIGLGRYK